MTDHQGSQEDLYAHPQAGVDAAIDRAEIAERQRKRRQWMIAITIVFSALLFAIALLMLINDYQVDHPEIVGLVWLMWLFTTILAIILKMVYIRDYDERNVHTEAFVVQL